MISTSSDQLIIVWDILNNFRKITTTKTSAALSSLALYSNDSFISGDIYGSIQIWSAKLSGNEKTLKGHNDSVSDLTFLFSGFLVSTSFDKSITIWDKTFNLWSSNSNTHSEDVIALKVNNNGVLISGSQDGTIHFWNTDYFVLDRSLFIY